MQYLISRDPQEIRALYFIFEQSYRHLLNERCAEVFEDAIKSVSCVSILKEFDEIVAFSFHREIECSDWANAPRYMSDTSVLFRKFIESRFKFLTIEWMTVHPDRLGKFKKVQPGDLILGLGFRLMANSRQNATIGFSRQDTRVDQMTTRFGAELKGTVERLGISCSVVFLEDSKLTDHPVKKTQEQIDLLWKTRINQYSEIERKFSA